MADKKVSQEDAASAFDGSEEFRLVQAGLNKKGTSAQMATHALATLPAALAALGVPQTHTVTLDAADLALLGTSDVEVFAALGAGKIIDPSSGFAQLKANGGIFGNATANITRFFWGNSTTGLQWFCDTDVGVPQLTDLFQTLWNGVCDPVVRFVQQAEAIKEDFEGVDPAVLADLPLVLSADAAMGITGALISTGLQAGNGGDSWVPGNTFKVPGGLLDPTLATGVVDTVLNSFVITAVSTVGKTFTVAGDASAFAPTDTIPVYGSTGNDGFYTLVSAVFAAGSTVLTVVEAIPDATADGRLGDQTIGNYGEIATFHLTNNVNGYDSSFINAAVTIEATSGVGENAQITVTGLDYSVNPITLEVSIDYRQRTV